ncbi:hypothetical protein C2845_PM11G01240 [Panicum miliaceum]|uniref:ABC transporter domain-containing protein n=1 Tax=Panicum miliaceum TaxID=4540 RepID=A0A3L6RU64_PANMI|nr:hypothetical protein C2845_PM11G01240 [Panicum miliaceum]
MGASRLEQTNALFRKNLVIQRRACKTNCCLVLFPLLLCSVIGGLQIAVNRATPPEAPIVCGCSNVTVDEDAVGGLSCPLPRAPRWPPVLQIPPPEYRAVGDGLFPFTDLPDASCRAGGSCPATFLVTGGNQSFVASKCAVGSSACSHKVILSSLVYEKQQKLRAMMKMHGLGDIAYWLISYCYFLLISLVYMLLLVTFGSVVGIKLFASNSYVLQFIIYFTYMNLQISSAFLMTSYFTAVTTATGSLIMLMEFFPPFSLYRITYELSPPLATGFYSDFSGVQMGDLSNLENGILVLLIIMREIVDKFLQQPDSSYSIIIDNIRKVYPPKDGNAEKVAVKGFSLAIQRGQCFGLLGSNGAGKTSLISMDEPSSGLDPASRNALWNAVKFAKKDRAIILTTHSMEEAEALCDRIGISAYGRLRCTGTSKELKAKYGSTFVFTVTAVAGEDEAVEQLVRSISPTAKRTYHIAGTQKFEMPKQGVKISEVFRAMEQAKGSLNIAAWGLVDTTLEDVFIKVAKESGKCSD